MVHLSKHYSFLFLGILILSGVFNLNSCASEDLTEIYVSPEGNDQANGRRSHPVATLQRAAELARAKAGQAPVTIWLGDGVYHLTTPLSLGVEDSGAPEATVSWRAMPGANPVISGGIQIKGWQEEENGRWSAPLPENVSDDFRSFYVNDRRAVRARFPNEGFLRISKAGEDDRTNFFFEENDFPEVQDARSLELVLLHDWSISRVGVRAIDWKDRRLFAADTIGALSPSFFTLTNWEAQPRYYLENAPEFLDQPGEWYLDAGARRIYYLPLPDEKIDQVEAIVPLASKLLTIRGDLNQRTYAGFIEFEGIAFEHTDWPLPPGGYCGIQACMFDNRTGDIDGWNKVPAAIELDLTQRVVFKNCVVRHTGGSGIWIRQAGRENVVEGCRLYDISGNGVNIGEGQNRLVDGIPWWRSQPEQVCQGTRIANCLVEDCGVQFYGAVGIWGGLVAQTTIDHNEVRNLPYTGVSVGWMWDTIPTPCRANTISNNHIHHVMNILSDGGGIYNLGLQPGSRITGNLIHDVSVNAGRAESNGMFLDEGIKDVVVENNVIYNIARSPLRFHRASTNIVRSNVLVCGDGVPPIRYNRTREEDIRQEENVVLSQSLASDMERLRSLIGERLPDVGPGKDF